MDGNLKFAKVDKSRSHASKHEFKTFKKSTSVWNTKQGYNFETKKFVNKRTTYGYWVYSIIVGERREVDKGSRETPWL